MAATIIAGNFEDNSSATEAVKALVKGGVAPDQVCVFFLNPPGQHDTYPVGYTGALAGALSKTGRRPEKEAGEPASPPPRRAGMVVAVNVSAKAPEKLATDVLRQHGARDIERAHGTWTRGKWEDFDPLSTPQLVTN
jgi:hypothetical protein